MMRTGVLIATALFFSSPAFAGEEIQVAFAGKPRGPVTSYSVGSQRYISAKDAASIYGSPVYWYPLAGKLQLKISGKSLQFFLNSEDAVAEDRKFKLEAPIIARTSQAMIPLSFFRSKEFEAWSGLDTDFNTRTRLLSIERRTSVGPVRWFSYGQYSRLVLELAPGVSYSTSRRGASGLEIALPNGVIDAAEHVEMGDGFIASFSLRQEPKLVRLAVKLAVTGVNWHVRESKDPRRLILEIYKGDRRPAEAEPKIVKTEKSTASTSGAQVAQATAQTPLPQAVTPTGRTKRRIVIDAGHGGKDPGANGKRGTLEKDINLLAARELAQLLREEGAFEVLLTRTDDTFVPLGDRSRMSNEFDADLFVSLHCNAASSRKEQGFEIYFLSEKASDPDAERLAEFENSVLALEENGQGIDEASPLLLAMTKTEHINEASELSGLMARALEKRVDLENRGVKQAGFYVLRGTNAPAVLVELGFVTNAKDEVKLESKRYRRRIIDGVYAGLLEYAKRQEWLSNDQWTKLNR